MEIPYYGDVSVDGEPFCADCNEVDLYAKTISGYAECAKIVYGHRIECGNLKKCREIYRNTMKEAVKNTSPEESEEKS